MLPVIVSVEQQKMLVKFICDHTIFRGANIQESCQPTFVLFGRNKYSPYHTTTVLRPFFRDHPAESVPEEYFWTLWCKERILTEVDTPTIRLGATPSGLTSAHLHHPPFFYRPDALPVAEPTVSKH